MMMLKRLAGVLVCVGCAVGPCPTVSAQRRAAPIQADTVTHYKLPDGRVVSSSGHYYRHSRGLIREDHGSITQITDLSANTITALNHERKTAMVYTVPVADLGGTDKPNGRPTPKPAPFARGLVEGHRVSKTRTTGPDGAALEIWTADDLGGFVVMRRTQAGNATTAKTFRNLKTTEPDRSLFEIPSDYTVTHTSLDKRAFEGRAGRSGKPGGRGRGGAPTLLDRR